MGKGTTKTRRPSLRSEARPALPTDADAVRVLGRVKARLVAAQRGDELVAPDTAERTMLRWLQWELGLDEDMDVSEHYRGLYELLAEKAQGVLEGIQHPSAALGKGAAYPLETGEVTALLRKLGVRVDPSGAAVRRLGDAFDVPELGPIGQRVFFARHVLRIAAAHGAGMSDSEVAALVRHITGDLSPIEALVARTIEDPPPQTEELLARVQPAATEDIALHFASR